MSDDDPNDALRRRAAELFAQDAAGIPPKAPPTAGMPFDVGPSASTNWRTMQDVQARDEWIALRDWVEWVTVRYDIPISTVPICWWRHGALVEELSALHCAHRAAFDPTDSGSGPLGWHERFAIAHARLTRAYAGGCSQGHHAMQPRSWSDAPDDDEWAAWIEQSHAH